VGLVSDSEREQRGQSLLWEPSRITRGKGGAPGLASLAWTSLDCAFRPSTPHEQYNARLAALMYDSALWFCVHTGLLMAEEERDWTLLAQGAEAVSRMM
jgi:hypothetical protein